MRIPGCHLVAGLLAAGAAHAAPLDEDLVLKELTLYRAGVGYFEHAARIDGDRTFRLRLPIHALDDILKSMTLLDLGGGEIGPVRYGSKDPLERRLSRFGVDISKAPGTVELFGQLRGAPLRVRTAGDVIEGTIVGVEERPIGETAVQQSHVTLLTASGIRAVNVASIVAFELLDETLAEELDLALRALAEQRSERMKAVELSFFGPEGAPRTVVVAYVQEVPVWKTSYRLALPGEEGESATLQAYAIVENTTGEDWEGVRLSLAAGDPISYTMDLDQPIFAARPWLPVPLPEGLSPLVAESESDDQPATRWKTYRGLAGESSLVDEMEALAATAATGDPAALRRMKQIQAELAVLSDAAEGRPRRDPYAVEASALGEAQATGAAVGDEFRYTVDVPVTIDCQSSAMLPILLAEVSARRVSIHGPEAESLVWPRDESTPRAVLAQIVRTASDGRVLAAPVDPYDAPDHPIKGIELTNATDVSWLPGPLGVYDGGSFAGDARVEDVQPGGSCLIGYARDTAVAVRSQGSAANRLIRVRIAGGRVEQSLKERQARTYTFRNHDPTRPRTILLEHPRKEGWDLVEPGPPTDETERFYRFEFEVPAEGEASLTVAQEIVRRSTFAVGNIALESAVVWQGNGLATEAFVDALRRAEELRRAVAGAEARVEVLERERSAIFAEQERLRANLPHLDPKSALARRYLAKLSAQETRLEELAARRKEAARAADGATTAYDDYLRELDVR